MNDFTYTCIFIREIIFVNNTLIINTHFRILRIRSKMKNLHNICNIEKKKQNFFNTKKVK